MHACADQTTFVWRERQLQPVAESIAVPTFRLRNRERIVHFKAQAPLASCSAPGSTVGDSNTGYLRVCVAPESRAVIGVPGWTAGQRRDRERAWCVSVGTLSTLPPTTTRARRRWWRWWRGWNWRYLPMAADEDLRSTITVAVDSHVRPTPPPRKHPRPFTTLVTELHRLSKLVACKVLERWRYVDTVLPPKAQP